MNEIKGGKTEISFHTVETYCLYMSFVAEKLRHLTAAYIDKYDLDEKEILEDDKARFFATHKTSMWLDMEIIDDYARELYTESKKLENLLEYGNEKGENADEEEK